MPRRKLDQYFTPTFATRVLLDYHPEIRGTIIECCSGTGQIADELIPRGVVLTNDIDPEMPSQQHRDATSPDFWLAVKASTCDWAGDPLARAEWVVSNPPFNVCASIVQQAVQTAAVGVAMLLRLSFLEPCKDRDVFLSTHPPDHLIVLPRISFTGDGKTDNCTCAWFVWHTDRLCATVKHAQQRLTVVTRDEAGNYRNAVCG